VVVTCPNGFVVVVGNVFVLSYVTVLTLPLASRVQVMFPHTSYSAPVTESQFVAFVRCPFVGVVVPFGEAHPPVPSYKNVFCATRLTELVLLLL
jgi:hypothetical protein